MIRILIVILAGLVFPPQSFSEPYLFSNPSGLSDPQIKLNVLVDKDTVQPEDSFRIYLSAQMEEGWHIYSLEPLDGNELLATQIILDEEIFESSEDWQESPTSLIQDDAQEKMVKAHTATAEFFKSFYVSENFTSGNYTINGKLLYRACNNKLCTLPKSLPFTARIRVASMD